MPYLVRLTDDGTGRIEEVLDLPGTDNLVGRGVGVHVSLIDETVSRMHARVVGEDGRWVAQTLNSNNPVRVGGQPVKIVELRPGSVIELGRVRLRFELTDPRRMSTLVVHPKPGEPSNAEPPGPTPAMEPAPVPVVPERKEPEAARGSWTAMPEDVPHVPGAAQARVNAVGLGPLVETSPPDAPVDHEADTRPSRGSANTVVERRWPWVLLGVGIGLLAAGAVFHQRIGDYIEHAGASEGGDEASDAAP